MAAFRLLPAMIAGLVLASGMAWAQAQLGSAIVGSWAGLVAGVVETELTVAASYGPDGNVGSVRFGTPWNCKLGIEKVRPAGRTYQLHLWRPTGGFCAQLYGGMLKVAPSVPDVLASETLSFEAVTAGGKRVLASTLKRTRPAVP